MVIQLEIPDSIQTRLQVPEAEVEPRLRLELAVALYAQDALSFGKAYELAGVSRYVFADVLTEREIPRHYTEEDLEIDLRYARGQ